MNNNILFIDLSKNFCKIYILYNNKIINFKKYSYKNHMNNTLYILNKILLNNNINIKKIDIISCIKDTNSITSFKIGYSICIGLSISLNIPIIKISLFEIISEKIFKIFKINNNILLSFKYYSNFFIWGICNKKKNGKWIIKKNVSNIKNILNFLYKQNGDWIFNTINLNMIYKTKYKNLNIKYLNYINYKPNDIFKIIIKKLVF